MKELERNKLKNKVMKLIITIPAYNEEETIAKVIKEIPRSIEGINEVKVLVINDGSIDKTVEIAKEAGADYVISNSGNQGLAFSFRKGIESALKLGADIIVNTDADFQYNQTEIPKLIRPILENRAEMVIGNRQVETLSHMKWTNKYGNILGSWVLRKMLKNKVTDASSGFRAFSKECALRLNILSGHTYTHETIIQCTMQKMRIMEIPVEFRKREAGNSKLILNVSTHIKKSSATIIRIYLTYEPFKTFSKFGSFIFLIGGFFYLRYLWFYFLGRSGGHIQSLLLGVTLTIIGILIIILGFIADLIATNRRINEEILYKLKKQEYEKSN
jgi:glycosyltransferase involved in cell wall biosynthesis